MDKLKKIMNKIFSAEYFLFWLVAIACIVLGIITPAFYSFYNIMNILRNSSYIALMVLGLTWVIASGEMDCSFPDIAACSSMVFAYSVLNGVGIVGAILLALVVGILLGVVTSILVVKFNFHSLITTIAVATIARSIAAALNGGMPLGTPVIKSSFLYKLLNSSIGGFPLVFIIVLLIYAILVLIQERTKFGQYIYALGENRKAVKESGIKVNINLSIIFISSALFAALAGILMVFVVYGSGQPKMGSSFFLDGFTVVFLGAMAFKIGKCNVVGTFLGAILLALIVNGLTLMGASFATSQIVKGILLVLGIVIVAIAQKKRKGNKGVLKYE
jgi:ribose/xylose/arabinose/galactoside ABC-type transport system permease subunit